MFMSTAFSEAAGLKVPGLQGFGAHPEEFQAGSQKSADPVSSMTVYRLGGVPTVMLTR
jgi:hypothetical protein